jgi:hypothetical protein
MKMRIAIEVERKDAPLTDADLCRAADFVRGVVEVVDAQDSGHRPWGNEPTDGLWYEYTVEEVKP